MEPGVVLLDDAGRLRAATPAAARVLALLDEPAEPTLRALGGRVTMAGSGASAVITVPLAGGGAVVFTGARAERELTVVVEVREDPLGDVGAFTAREREVLRLITQGLPTKRIAAVLRISPWTVQRHLQSMFAKTGVSSRGELVAQTQRGALVG